MGALARGLAPTSYTTTWGTTPLAEAPLRGSRLDKPATQVVRTIPHPPRRKEDRR